MSTSYPWAVSGSYTAGPSNYAAAPTPTSPAVKTKRGRFSDSRPDSSVAVQLPSIVHPSSPQLVPRNSSSASSWGVAELSDSDGDYDWNSYTASIAPHQSVLANIQANNHTATSSSVHSNQCDSPDLGRDDLAAFARPAKRAHLETQEDRQTYGQFAGMQIHSTSFVFDSSSERPTAGRANSGLAGAFGLGPSLSSPYSSSGAPTVPPSSPTKIAIQSTSHPSSAFSIYQQAVSGPESSIPPPPTSPEPFAQGLQALADIQQTVPSKRRNSLDLEDSDMRVRKAPTSYEVEPDRVVVTSLDDTSSSASEADDEHPPEADTSTESKDSATSSSEFVINHELIEKLEAHRRAVLTGTSERDNNAASSSSTNGSSARSRRTGGRRSAGGGSGASNGLSHFGILLNSKRRSAQSSASSSGFASPNGNGTSEDPHSRGALILWKDPGQVLNSAPVSVSSSSPLKAIAQQDVTTDRPSSTLAILAPTSPFGGFMSQAPVAFTSSESGQTFISPSMQSHATAVSAAETPLYAQQSSLSSSYFPAASSFGKQMQNKDAASAPSAQPKAWGVPTSYQSSSQAQYQHQHQYSHQTQAQHHQTQYRPSSPSQQFEQCHPDIGTSLNGMHSSYPATASDQMELDG